MIRYNQSAGRRGSNGVTLIELLITVSIIGILAAVAYPSYQRYVARTHRNVAAACLSQYSTFMERFYTTHLTYSDADPSLSCRNENGMNRHYRFEVAVNDDGRGYLARAIPQAAQADLDSGCGTLTLNQAGARTPMTHACW